MLSLVNARADHEVVLFFLLHSGDFIFGADRRCFINVRLFNGCVFVCVCLAVLVRHKKRKEWMNHSAWFCLAWLWLWRDNGFR